MTDKPVALAIAEASFQTPLNVTYEDGRNWVVLSEFIYVSPRIAVHVPVGFETDFASIPKAVWWWMSPTDKRIGKPAVIHDWIYRNPSVAMTRAQADNELREAMKCVGTGVFDRNAVYYAVRAGGGHSFKARSVTS